MMRKFAFILALSFTAFSYGCATTQHSQEGTWASWPSQTTMSQNLKDAIHKMKTGNLQAADELLTHAVRAQEPAAQYMHAEIMAFKGLTALAVDLLTDFIAQNPDHPLTTAAMVRILALSNTTHSPLNWDKVSSLKVSDPYAAARLVILHNRALRDTHNPDLKHPSAIPLVKWQWMGPFSPYIYTGFEDVQPFDADPIIADSYEIEGKLLERFQYPEDDSTPMAASISGVYVAETRISVAHDLPLQLTVQGAHLYTIFVDGEPVLTRDFQQYGKESVLSARFDLTQGEHIIRLRLGLNAASDSAHHIALWISPEPGHDSEVSLSDISELDDLSGALSENGVKNIQRIDLTHVLGQQVEPIQDETLRTWVAASMAVQTGNISFAEALLNAELQTSPDDYIAQYWQALRYNADSDLDPSLRSENAIHILKNIAQNAPQMAIVQQRLIGEFIKQQQPKQALEIWENHKDTLPQNAEMDALLGDLTKALEWTDLSNDYDLKAAQNCPDSCSLVASALAIQFRKNAYTSFEQLPENIRKCPNVIRSYAKLEGNDASSPSKWTQALQQLARQYPNESGLILDAILAKASSEPETATTEFINHIEAVARGFYPNIPTNEALELIDILRSQQREQEANQILDKIIELFPGAEIFQNMKWQKQLEKPLSDLRIDSQKTIEDYIAKNRTDPGSSVMILDYAATRIYPTGAKLNLTHQISRVLSKEGKNEVGEIYLPPHASVLKIRTLKDLTFEVFEPESIDFKDSITAPNLDVGDYVEVEYLTFEPALSKFIPRVSTDTFFYGSNQSPLVRSEYVFEYPKDWDVQIIESGPKDLIQRSCEPHGDFIRCVAKREDIPVFIPEPRAPSGIDLIPNIQFYHLYDWNFVRNGLYESITRQSRYTPYIQRFYDQIAFPQTDSTWERARTIYDQVIQSIDENETVRTNDDETATNSVTRGTGSRFMTLKALYDLAGIPCYFALVRSVLAPENAENLPSLYDNAYVTLLVVETEKGLAYLLPTEDFMPFDFLSSDLQGQQAIPLDPKHEIFTTRMNDTESLRATIDIQYQIATDGTAQASSVEVMRGSRAFVMRNFLNTVRYDTDKANQVVQNSLANSYGRIDLKRLDYLNLEDKNQPLTLNYDFDISSFATPSDGQLNIISRIFAYNLVNQYAPLPAAQRKYPVLIDTDLLSARSLTFHAPDGYSWNSTTLKDVDIHSEFGQYTRHTQTSGSTLQVKETIQLQPQRIQLAQYPAFRDFCLAVDEAQRTVIQAVK